MLIDFINKIIRFFQGNIEVADSTSTVPAEKNECIKTIYQSKPLMTDYEFSFYQKIKELEEKNLKIIPQINLATVIKKCNNTAYYTDLFRNIDFAIFTSDFSKLLLLIELNDSTHNFEKRKERDTKVKDICESAGIPLISFYSNYPNEKGYVIDRILKCINYKPETNKLEQDYVR